MVNEADRATIKQNILDALIHCPDIVRSQLGLAFRRMVDDDYPTKNADFSSKLLIALQTQVSRPG